MVMPQTESSAPLRTPEEIQGDQGSTTSLFEDEAGDQHEIDRDDGK